MLNTAIGGITFEFDRNHFEKYEAGIRKEWLLTNGLGGYSGSSIIDAPMRRHHGLLIASLHPPVKRFLILSKLNERITIGDTTYPMHTTKYSDRIIEGYKYLQHFSYDTYPIYTYEIKDTQIQKEVLLKYGTNSTIIKYTLKAGKEGMTFVATPCFNFKPHGEQGMKTDLSFEVKQESNNLLLIPKNTYAQKEEVKIQYRVSEGDFIRSSNLFDDRIYLDFEFETGSEGTDAHYTPYHHQVTLAPDEEKCVFIQCEVAPVDEDFDAKDIALEGYFLDAQTKHETRMKQLVLQAEAKHKLLKRLALSADQFICTRNSTGSKTVLAGLPWFTDWGRDTMIALCGLTLSTNRFDVAKEILRSFSKYENNGLLPNVFPDEDTKPMYNSVDASLWYFQAIYQYYRHTKDLDFIKEIYPTLEKVYDSFVEGTDFSIYMDDDCLIHAGSGLDQVTWMDVRINGVCVTPRHGKPVEINALWYNASMIMDRFSKSLHRQNKQYLDIAAATKASFTEKFINPDIQGLNDVVDPIDSSFRPNQIYAVSLPFSMLDEEQSKMVVDSVYVRLYTPYGLRSLSVDHTDYKPVYQGPVLERDFAYHQGTVWGFLLGGFISAYKKVYTEIDNEELYNRFVAPIEDHLFEGCLGGYSEIFDATPPYHHRGCYTQAWSVAEAIRILKELGC